MDGLGNPSYGYPNFCGLPYTLFSMGTKSVSLGRCRFAGAEDFRGRIVVLLLPLGDPARQPADGETDGEHVGGNADRPQQDAAVEIHVRIEPPLDEIGVGQGQLFEFAGDVQQRVLPLAFGRTPCRRPP